MSSDPSSYVFGSAQNDRIRAAEEYFDDGSKRVLSSIPFDRQGTSLEVGAGGGSIARWLSEAAEGDGRVIATDIDVTPLAGGAPPDRMEVRIHNIVDDDLEPEPFDLIHARLLLEHLPAREEVLRKLVGALRPGGWLVVEDVDYAGAVPVSEFGASLHEHVQSVRLAEFAKNGIDHYFGRRLPELMREAGLVEVQHDGRVNLMEGGSPGARWLKLSLMHVRPRLVGPDKVTDAEMDSMLELLDDPRWSAFGPIMIAAFGKRP
ncbi:MAG TPA: class I SAM-dependent methyltransferase [Acidimicrobiales bacterium]|nr:class I SAM-dependent methyltransferase [Acidimicrobiales bacterium]